MGYQLGIDLGTTYTAAAVCRSSDRRWVEPEVVTLGTRTATVPSVLYVAQDGTVLVGDAAQRRALTDPDRVVREFKRRIGDPTPVVVAGTAWAPEELAARLVRWVVEHVADREGGQAERIAVTHPASWGRHKLELLAGALAAHGLTVTFLAEPQAAALHYAAAERVPAGSTIAVYDLGGGTFDAAVVRKGDPAGAAGFGLLGRPEGLERLGGVDFDEVVFEHVRQGLPAAFDDLDDTDPAVLAAVSRIRSECTEAKEALSADTEVSIPVLLPSSGGSVRLHRSEFEGMIRPQVDETVEALRRAVASAGLAPEHLTAVLLVGGSSRIPLVAQLVSERLGRPVAVDADPKNAIAKGAALAVSPRPTASWPGVAIAPVAAAPGAPGAAPPGARPPFAPASPPRGSAPVAPGRTAPLPPAGRGFPAPAPARPSHEPAAAMLSGAAAAPPTPPRPGPDWAYEPEPPQRNRPIGLLIGIGGLLAAVAVIVALLVWPDSPASRSNIGTDSGEAGTASVVAPAGGGGPAPAPAPGGGSGGTGGGTTAGKKSGSAGGAPAGTAGQTSTTPGGGATATAPASLPPSTQPSAAPASAGGGGTPAAEPTGGNASGPPTGSGSGTTSPQASGPGGGGTVGEGGSDDTPPSSVPVAQSVEPPQPTGPPTTLAV